MTAQMQIVLFGAPASMPHSITVSIRGVSMRGKQENPRTRPD